MKKFIGLLLLFLSFYIGSVLWITDWIELLPHDKFLIVWMGVIVIGIACAIASVNKWFVRKTICGRCNGSGKIQMFNMLKDECPRCDGTGTQSNT